MNPSSLWSLILGATCIGFAFSFGRMAATDLYVFLSNRIYSTKR